jgi:chromosome segregation ATPase
MIPTFDPLAELQQLKSNSFELARAYNDHSSIIEQLLHQNRQLNHLLAQRGREIAQLARRIDQLESSSTKATDINPQ